MQMHRKLVGAVGSFVVAGLLAAPAAPAESIVELPGPGGGVPLCELLFNLFPATTGPVGAMHTTIESACTA